MSASVIAQNGSHRIDYEADLADWNLLDMDGSGRRELIAWTEGPNGDRHLVVHRQDSDGSFVHAGSIALPSMAAVRALGDFDGQDGTEISILTPTGVHLIFMSSDKVPTLTDELFQINSLFRAASSGTPDFLHWSLDVDDDGHDDLLTPLEEGLGVCFGDGNRGFSKPMVLELPGRRTIATAADGFLSLGRSYPRAVFENISGSQLPDLVWFDEDGLSWREQTAPRVFRTGNPATYPLSWLSGEDTTGVLEQTDVELEDLSSSEGLDLVLSRMKTRKESLTRMRTNLVLLANQGKEKAATFSRKPSLALRIEGVVGSGPHFVDVDGDGLKDMMLTTYASGLKDAFSRFVASTVPARVYVHRGIKGKRLFEATPSFKATFQLSTQDFQRWGVRRSPVLHEDITGDGIVDLFQMKHSGKSHLLTIRRGEVTNGKFSLVEKPIFSESVEGVENVSFRTLKSGDKGSHVIVQGDRFIKVLVLDTTNQNR